MSPEFQRFSPTRTARRITANPAVRTMVRCVLMCAIQASRQGTWRSTSGCGVKRPVAMT